MCSYRTIADRVECCMDDLIECFEDYIAKSLLAITIALGIIVASVVYLLKIVSEQTLERSDSNTRNVRVRGSENRNLRSLRLGWQNRQERQGRQDRDVQDRQNRQDLQNTQDRLAIVERYDREDRNERYDKQGRRKGEAESQSRRGIANENYLMLGNKDQQISTAVTNKAGSVPSFDESVLREVGLSCCQKPCCLAKRRLQNKNISKDKPDNIAKDVSKKDDVSKGISQNERMYKGKSQNEKLSKEKSDMENITQQKSPNNRLAEQRTSDKSLSTKKSPDESLSVRKLQYESLTARRSQYEGLATQRSQYKSLSRDPATHPSSDPQRPYDIIRPSSRLSIPVVPRSINSPRHSLQSLRICPASSRASSCSMCKKDSRHCIQ